MKTYLNIETGLLTAEANGTSPIRRLAAKRGDTLELEVVPSAPMADATGILVAKRKGIYSGEVIVLDSAWSAPETEGAGYLFSLSLNTDPLNALFIDEKSEEVLMGEITWTVGSVTRSSQTFDLVVARDVWRGDEGAPSPVTPLTSFDIQSVTGLTRWRITIDDAGVILRTALALMALCAFSAGAMGQTVRDLTTTNGTLQGTSLRINTATNFNFGGVGGSLQVEAQGGNHAIAARASDEADGAAFYGWSESGAPAMKLVQSNNFNSPALTVWRTPNGNDALSSAVLIAGSPTNGTNIALKVQRGSTNVFTVNFNGLPSLPSAATVTTAIDWAASSTFTHSLTGNKTFTFTNSADGQTIIVRVVNPASHTVTWPSVKWRVGTPPTQTASGTDIYTFINIGGTIYGAQNADLR
jgi:hypothetical protein